MKPQEFVRVLVLACPDLEFCVDDVQGVDEVTVRWSLNGTYACQLPEMTPVGKKVHLKGVSVYRMVNGSPMETRDEVDISEALVQLGAGLA